MTAEAPYQLPAGLELPDRHGWPVTLRYGPVVLRPLGRRDRSQWLRIRERSAAWLEPWEPTAPPGCEPPASSFGAVVRSLSGHAARNTMLPWAVAWDCDGRPDSKAPLVGQLTMASITLGAARSASLGYWIDVEHAGRGIIPTAVALACDYAFAVMRLHRLEICLRPENGASTRVVEKLGFRCEGLRPRYLHIDGDWRDHVVYALHDDEVDEGLLVRLSALGMTAV